MPPRKAQYSFTLVSLFAPGPMSTLERPRSVRARRSKAERRSAETSKAFSGARTSSSAPSSKVPVNATAATPSDKTKRPRGSQSSQRRRDYTRSSSGRLRVQTSRKKGRSNHSKNSVKASNNASVRGGRARCRPQTARAESRLRKPVGATPLAPSSSRNLSHKRTVASAGSGAAPCHAPSTRSRPVTTRAGAHPTVREGVERVGRESWRSRCVSVLQTHFSLSVSPTATLSQMIPQKHKTYKTVSF